MLKEMANRIKGKNIKIVFPEGNDKRVIEAAHKLKQDGLIIPVIIHDKKIDGLETIIINEYDKMEELVKKAMEIRKDKWDEETTRNNLSKSNYLGTMLVKEKIVDGLVGGATYSTADTMRPALQLVKTKPGANIVSSIIIMIKDGEYLIMGDCAINPEPNSSQLAEIAMQSANTAKDFGIEPKVGMLSFSTNGSAKHPLVSKVQDAVEILKSSNVDFKYVGEVQFDAAINETVGKKKFPDSDVAGKVNTFIFPDLQAGNIGYKIAERMGGWTAIGPIIQGLNSPINDLSRGCSVEDIYNLAIITADQVG